MFWPFEREKERFFHEPSTIQKHPKKLRYVLPFCMQPTQDRIDRAGWAEAPREAEAG
jgi:hypothetical protein